MLSKRIVGAAVAVLSVAAALTPASAAGAAATTKLAVWEMNEPRGASTMQDSSGSNIDGRIGDHVVTGVAAGASKGYQFPWIAPNTPPADPEHLVTVGDGRLNPGTRNYAVTMRFKTSHSFGNIIQKGQSGTVGGYFKWQLPQGKLQCLFRGAAGSIAVSSLTKRLNDNVFHTVRCERTAQGVTMWVDGVKKGQKAGPTGSIANDKPLTIAGKAQCDQVRVTCDYFVGVIDRVQIEVW